MQDTLKPSNNFMTGHMHYQFLVFVHYKSTKVLMHTVELNVFVV